jgi:uncharacterized damage-inducible protein DinB
MLTRPHASEYAEYYATYIRQVPDGDILATLAAQIEDTASRLSHLPAGRETFRYAPGKWSVRDVVGHMVDVERLFAFRALWFARNAEGALPSMDQESWAASSNAGDRPLADLVAEFRTARAATLTLFASFDAEICLRRGVASGNPFTVRSLAWMIAGHENHHKAGLIRDYGI